MEERKENITMNRVSTLYLSIIIPVFNEKEILNQTIGDIDKYFIGKEDFLEFIIVNDNSTDASMEIIRNKFTGRDHVRVIDNKTRQGKALSIRDGVMIAEGKYVIFMDADLSTPLKEIDRFFKYMKKGHDIIIGVRNERNKTTTVKRPISRRIVSRIYTALCNILFFKGSIADVGCGFKVFKKKIAQSLFLDLYIKSWVFDVEILSKALRNNYKIKEVPVEWIFKGPSSLNILKDSVAAFFALLRFKLFLIKNRRESR